MGWESWLGGQAFDIREQIPFRVRLMADLKRGLGSKVLGLAANLLNPFSKGGIGQFIPQTVPAHAKLFAAGAGTGAALLGGRGALAAAAPLVEKLRDSGMAGRVGGAVGKAVGRGAASEAKRQVKAKLFPRKKKAPPKPPKQKARRAAAPRKSPKPKRRKSTKPPTAKQKANWARFAAMARARAKARKGG